MKEYYNKSLLFSVPDISFPLIYLLSKNIWENLTEWEKTLMEEAKEIGR